MLIRGVLRSWARDDVRAEPGLVRPGGKPIGTLLQRGANERLGIVRVGQLYRLSCGAARGA